MIETTPDSQPLLNLTSNVASVFEQLTSTHSAITFTVDGQPEFVLQKAAEYQRLMAIASQIEEDEAIRAGLAQMETGETRPMNEVFDELLNRRALPR